MFFIWGIWLSFELHQAWSITLPLAAMWPFLDCPIQLLQLSWAGITCSCLPTHPDICIAICLPSKLHIYITYVLPVRSIYCCTLSDFTHFCVWNFDGSSCSPITLTFWKLEKFSPCDWYWILLSAWNVVGFAYLFFNYGPLINFALYFLSLM